MLGQAELIFFYDAASRPEAIDRWPAGAWQSVPLRHAPERVWEQLLLPLALRRHRVDVFHWPSGAGGLLLRPLAGCRVVVTVHDLIPLVFPEYFRSAMHRRYFHFLLALSRRADAVITVSEASKNDLVMRGRFEPSTITVIGEAVDRELVAQELQAPTLTQPGRERPYLLTMGSGEPRKNVARVIAAFEQVAGDIPHDLLVVGAPWRGRDIAIPPGGRIRALGAVTNARLRELYAGATAFIYPSLYEGFGLPVLEAMAAGIPVISSEAGSLAEIAGSAALYVDPRDPRSIASAIVELVSNPQKREALVAAGRARLRLFSWQTAARQTIEVYKRAAGRG
jgi:glycosyltransferase involved in cell wall biosynthesis